MAEKKYHWLKLPSGFFDSRQMKKLRKIAGGDTFTIIYLKMLLMSMKNDGRIYYEGVDESIADEIALEIDEDPDNVVVTISFLQKCGMLQYGSSDEVFLTELPGMVGSESASAKRVREHRIRQKALQCNADVTPSNALVTDCNTEKEIDIEKEYIYKQQTTNSNINIIYIHKGVHRNVIVDEEEFCQMCDEYGEETVGLYIDKLSIYMYNNGKNYREPLNIIREWINSDLKGA